MSGDVTAVHGAGASPPCGATRGPTVAIPLEHPGPGAMLVLTAAASGRALG
jgi:hypothetical protein